MLNWIRQLDRLLRGELTQPNTLRRDGLDVPILGLAVLIDLLGFIYGACMGMFAITGSGSGAWLQIPASMVKVPALYLLTLLVTLPSLYVVNALIGSRLTLLATVRLLVSSLAIMLAVLASGGPIVAFFSASTTSYPFMVLLNVVVFALAGVLGLAFLLQTLHRMTVAAEPEQPPTAATGKGASPSGAEGAEPVVVIFPPTANPSVSALDKLEDQILGKHVRSVFRVWLVVFALVGSQMGWVLRPFIGAPGTPFTFLRPKQSSFFQAVGNQVLHLVWDDDWKSRR